ncbi:hypothetical protein L7F22_029457 [Adiantum nelumboides]|nr:hypothetical protein [Adiantum nelumboides]
MLSAGILARRSVAQTARAVCPRLFSLLPQPEKPLNRPIRQYSAGLFSPAAWTSPSSVAPATSRLLRPAQPARSLSGTTPAVKEAQQAVQNDSTVTESTSNRVLLEVSDYWGIVPKQSQRREDGSPWPWHYFRSGVAGAAGPCRSLLQGAPRQPRAAARDSGGGAWHGGRHAAPFAFAAALRAQCRGWIKTLLDEAENERMHLMTWVEVLRPAWWERALVLVVQGTFFNAYFLLYLASPRLAWRIA